MDTYSFRIPEKITHRQGDKSVVLEKPFLFPIDSEAYLEGEYPRRVRRGDLLYSGKDGCRTLSPVPGLAKWDASVSSILIWQDGIWSQAKQAVHLPESVPEFIDKIKHLGLISLESRPAKCLAKTVSKFQGNPDQICVFSPFSQNQYFDYRELVFSEFESEWGEFLSLFSRLYPNVKILDFFSKPFKKFQHPDGLPAFFLQKHCGIASPDFSNVLFFGAETIYHLLRGLFLSEPFVSRKVAIFYLRQDGKLEREEKSPWIQGGQSLDFLSEHLSEDYRWVNLAAWWKEPVIVSRSEELPMNLLSIDSVIFLQEEPRKAGKGVCIECAECNVSCPTKAFPLSLVLENGPFLYQNCVECGICSVVCPSGINFREKIGNAKTIIV